MSRPAEHNYPGVVAEAKKIHTARWLGETTWNYLLIAWKPRRSTPQCDSVTIRWPSMTWTKVEIDIYSLPVLQALHSSMTHWLSETPNQKWLLKRAPLKSRSSPLKPDCPGPHSQGVLTGSNDYRKLGIRFESVSPHFFVSAFSLRTNCCSANQSQTKDVAHMVVSWCLVS